MDFVVGEGLIPSTKLYRYMDIESFMSFVETSKILFTNVNSWDDEWELILSKLPLEKDNGELVYPLYSFHEDIFGQSWSLNQESDAMWRIYSPSKTGVKIATSVEKFKMIRGMKRCRVEKVVYFGSVDQLIELSSAHSSPFKDALFKRNVFDHEREVRVLTHGDVLDHFERGWTHVALPVDIDKFIEGVTLDPRADDWFVDTIERYCGRIGLSIKPIKSSLYEPEPHLKLGLVMKFVKVKDEDEETA